MFPKTDEIERVRIENALPFMVNENNEIVCIPKKNDPPAVGIFGARGTCKTFMALGLAGRVYCYYGDPVFMSNDYTSESLNWTQPQDNQRFKRMLKYIGENPVKLPFVHVYPNNRDLEIGNSKFYLKHGISFKKYISRIETFRDMGHSLEYFKNIEKAILSLKKISSENVIDEINKADMPSKSKRMFRNILLEVFNEKLLDIEKDTIGEVNLENCKVDEGNYDLISGLMYSGYIPILMNYSIMGKPYMHRYYAHIMRNIIENQTRGYSFKYKKTIHIFIDELSKLTTKKSPTESTQIINEYFTRGRPLRIAVYYATQNPSLLPQEIHANTKYVICLRNEKNEIKKVAENFDIKGGDVDYINSLDKFSAYARTSDEKFLFFNPITKKHYFDSGVVRGKLLPPLCSTMPPISRGDII